MLSNHNDLIAAIHARQMVLVTWPSQEDGGLILQRACAPMDFGPSRRTKDGLDRYHFWDYDSDSGTPHPLSLLPEQISSVEVLNETFDPAGFVTWPTDWHVQRTSWGAHN